ncbi:MAG: UDP-N-acetylglucosamine 2-epimerase [Nitrososphaera sp.]|nr:UDP-N-acetylglucosamine 2-epimerase [Nitrososphaera sp.]
MAKLVCVVITSRASYGRIKSVLSAIKAHKALRLQLIVAGSALLYRQGRINEYLEKDGFTIDQECYSVVEGSTNNTMALSTGLLLTHICTALMNLNPDIVLTIADRHETIATAIAASYLNIPLAHLQGGEVSGSIDESVRHAITKLAHIHFPASQTAAKRLLQLGENPASIHVVGCPSIDIAKLAVSHSPNLDAYNGIGPRVNIKEPFMMVLQHPVTTELMARQQIRITLEAMHELGYPTIWLSPNIDAGSAEAENEIRQFRERFNCNVCFYRSFEPLDFYALLSRTSVFIGNSSSAIREGAFLGTPCVNIGTRQNNREHAANVVHAKHHLVDILSAIRHQLGHGKYPQSLCYGNGRSGPKIAEILAESELSIQKRFWSIDELRDLRIDV